MNFSYFVKFQLYTFLFKSVFNFEHNSKTKNIGQAYREILMIWGMQNAFFENILSSFEVVLILKAFFYIFSSRGWNIFWLDENDGKQSGIWEYWCESQGNRAKIGVARDEGEYRARY